MIKKSRFKEIKKLLEREDVKLLLEKIIDKECKRREKEKRKALQRIFNDE